MGGKWPCSNKFNLLVIKKYELNDNFYYTPDTRAIPFSMRGVCQHDLTRLGCGFQWLVYHGIRLL